MGVYEELLQYGHDRIFEILKDVKLKDDQFTYTKFNETCLETMFWKNRGETPIDHDSLKKCTPGLYRECRKCNDFYYPKRSDSVKKNDIKTYAPLEDVIVDFLKERYGLNIVHGDDVNMKYPDCKLVDINGKPLAYFEVKYHGAPYVMLKKKVGRDCYEGSITLDSDKVKRQIEIIDDEINCPVFFLHWVDYPCLKGIFIESADLVKDELCIQGIAYTRKVRIGDYISGDMTKRENGYRDKFYSRLLRMVTFDIFIDVLSEFQLEAQYLNSISA